MVLFPPLSSEPDRQVEIAKAIRAVRMGAVIGAAVACAGVLIAGSATPGGFTLAIAAAVGVACGAGLVGLLSARAIRQILLHKQDAAAPLALTPSSPSFQAVLEALPDPVMVISASEADDIANRRVLFANPKARELFPGAGGGGLLISVVRAPEVLESVDEALFGNIARQINYEPGGPQGRIWRAWSKPLKSPDGVARLALLTLTDETDSRRMERMRADFLANASHELRTPLASLSGFIETLRGHAKDDPEARDRFLRVMAAQAERMGRLVNDLLSLSRIELNEHIPPSGDEDLVRAVRDVIDALTPIAAEKHVALQVRMPDLGQAYVRGDRDQLIQVAQNLIDNAIKYTLPGDAVEIEIELSASQDAVLSGRPAMSGRMSLLRPDRVAGVAFAVLRVADKGPGIAREHLPRLSERFYRVEGQKSGARLGTGLGLAIVKHVVNRHRGGLVVDSTVGEGTVFTAYFPMTAPEAGTLSSSRSAA